MELSHYLGLYPAYFSALLTWLFFAPYLKIENELEELTFKKPWLEFLFALLAVGLTLIIGQLFINGFLLPKNTKFDFVFNSINHILIFSPFALLLIVRKQSPETAWIPKEKWIKSLFVGCFLAILAIFVFLLTKGKANEFFLALKSVYSLKNVPNLFQVFMEDFAIAICFLRFRAMIGKRWALIIVGILFSAAHIPAMIATGVSLEHFAGLLFDAGLGIFALIILSRSRNILWFWMVHFAMDMMQYY